MELFLVIIKNTVHVLLLAIQICMLIRAVMSWLPIDDNKFTDFLYLVTEPFITPVRMLFEKMHWFENFPLDMSFMISYLLISVLLIFI